MILKPTTPDALRDALRQAAEVIRAGGLVAFPTETVYGLGADATNQAAVQRIFQAKGRPSNNPVIVHVARWDDARPLVSAWPPEAALLSRKYPSGPLTLVLPAGSAIAPSVLAGGTTVGIRVPSHPMAVQLLRECGRPLAAPSANRSNSISPTTAEAVARSLGDRAPLILDGGPCQVGIESTVLDLTGPRPVILRPGMISAAELSVVLGVPVELHRGDSPKEAPLRSPGMLSRHYAPSTPLRLIKDIPAIPPPEAYLIRLGGGARGSREASLPAEPAAYAQQLYAALQTADASGASEILIECPPDDEQWAAILDRLRRAESRKTG